MLEDLLDLLKRQPADLRVEEDDQDPADTANSSVEAKRAARSHAFHHGEESGADDDVRAPAGASHEHCSDRPDLHGEEVDAHPGWLSC